MNCYICLNESVNYNKKFDIPYQIDKGEYTCYKCGKKICMYHNPRIHLKKINLKKDICDKCYEM